MLAAGVSAVAFVVVLSGDSLRTASQALLGKARGALVADEESAITAPRSAVTVIYKSPGTTDGFAPRPGATARSSEARDPPIKAPKAPLAVVKRTADLKPRSAPGTFARSTPAARHGSINEEKAKAVPAALEALPPARAAPSVAPIETARLPVKRQVHVALEERPPPASPTVPPMPVAAATSKSVEITSKTQSSLLGLRTETQTDDVTRSRATVATPIPVPRRETPKPRRGEVLADCLDCPRMVVVEPAQGEAYAGLGFAPRGARPAPFAIGVHEVTFADWDRCLAAGGCEKEPSDNDWGREGRPVINVSFKEVSEQYLPWLATKTKHAYRLPTEAEWELAQRLGVSANRSADGSAGDAAARCRIGNFSDLTADKTVAATCADGYAETAPVASFKANGLGIFDLEGNVWEWTVDCLRSGFSQDTAKNPEDCSSRVLKGGSWASAAHASRSGNRGWEKADKGKNSIGFRIVRSLE